MFGLGYNLLVHYVGFVRGKVRLGAKYSGHNPYPFPVARPGTAVFNVSAPKPWVGQTGCNLFRGYFIPFLEGRAGRARLGHCIPW